MRTPADLRPYQDRAVTALFESDGLALVLPMGAGKTAVALTAGRELIRHQVCRHGLVLAPKRVATLVWPREVAEWSHLSDVRLAVANGSPTQRELLFSTLDQRDFTALGIDNTIWLCDVLAQLPDGHPIFDLLVIDEISRFRSPKSERAKALLRHAARFKTIWGLTGTPRPNGYEDLFKPLAIVTREQLWGRSFYKWQRERFYPLDRNAYQWAILPQWEERTIAEARSVMLSLAPEDMPQLPPVTVVPHYVDLPADLYPRYRKMQRELFLEVPNGREILAASAGVATGKLAQMAQGFAYGEGGNADVEDLHDEKTAWIKDLVEAAAGNPMIIVYEYIEDLRQLRGLFGADLPYLGQGVTDRQAKENVDNWNAGKLPLLAMHAASGGHGLNLQFGGHQMAWFGLTWSSELFDQTVARIARPGQAHKVFVHVCIARDTVDELKRMRVVEKMSAEEAFKTFLKTI
jgi:SNF2-related domain